MKKRNILISIVTILIIAVIIAIIVYNMNNNNEINNQENAGNDIVESTENIQISEEGNIFLAKVISNEENKIIVVPNDNELIYQSFKLLNVLVNNNTIITKKDASNTTVAEIKEGSTVKIEFDGKILSTNPTNIIAKNIEIQ